MSSFGGARPKTSFKSSKKRKKSKRKDRKDEKKDVAMPCDKEENAKDEMIPRNPRRVQKEMLTDSPNKEGHPIGIMRNPYDFRNTSDLDRIPCSTLNSPKKISLPKDASGNINNSGNSSQYEREEGDRDTEGRQSANLENASQKKVDEVKSNCHLTAFNNTFFKEMEAICKSLEIASREYKEKSCPGSRSPFSPRLDTRDEKPHPVLDGNEQISKVSEKISNQGKNKMVEDKVHTELEEEDETIEEFKGNKVPPSSHHVQNKREIVSPTLRCTSPSSTNFEGTLPDPIEHTDYQDKPSSKGSEKMKDSKDGKSKTTKDKDAEIPVVSEKKTKIRTVSVKEKEILTEDEDEILSVREGEDELATTLEEDEILALLEGTDEISAALEEKDEMEVFQNERVPPLTHYLPNNKKGEINSPPPRSSTPFPSTSFDQTLLNLIGRIDNQDERNSEGSQKKLERKQWKNEKIENEVPEGLEEKDEMKKVFEKERVPPSLLSKNINEGKDDDDGNSNVEGQKSDFPSIKYDFSKYVLLWNRWSLVSEEAIYKAVKTISPCSKLRLKCSNYSSIWSYGIATFPCLKNAKLCVNFFREFTVKLKSLVDELKPLMDKKKRVMIETMEFSDDEILVVAETVFTWLNYIKILETETREFDQVEKVVTVRNRRIPRENLLLCFSFFGEISSLTSFKVSKNIMFSEHDIAFVHLFEVCAAMFAIDSKEYLQNVFPMSFSMNFDFFASRIERHFYGHLSSSFPLADVFSVLRCSTMQNQEFNVSQDSSEDWQQTEVETSGGDSEEGQQTEVETSQGGSEEGQQTEVGTSERGSEGGQQMKVQTSQGDGKEQEMKVGASQEDNKEQQTKVGASQGDNKEQQTKVGASLGDKEQQMKVEASLGDNKEQQQMKVGASQGDNKEQQTKVGASPGGRKEGQQPEPYVKKKPSEMKETGQVMGEIPSQSFRRNETSNEGKSQHSEKSNTVQEPKEEKSQRNDAESNPIQKSKRKGKKKRR